MIPFQHKVTPHLQVDEETGLCLRPPLKTDSHNIALHANDREVSIQLRDIFPHPYSLQDAERFIEFTSFDTSNLHFCVCLKDEAIGCLGVQFKNDVYFRSAEIGYWIGKKYWGRGIVTKCVKVVTKYVLENFDICRIFAEVSENNVGSSKVLEKAGFIQEGRLRKAITKDGKTYDALMYSIVI
eukprot:TRINITY_DN4781_c0_g1_i1.p1 TRINITY_DN4781_c0_g1~~TRINITY_DN4781_c0_g1_i1.p1  ORF type:complete len:183 (-),score=33.44 TRINITY_DN4781_c0_g1_i1:331-879(-)